MIGKTLGGRYEVLENIDSGGMAYVYKALCKKTEREVAVKVLKSEFAGSSEYVERFKREAQAAFQLEHENVVQVYDVGFDENSYYMVMEFVDGPTLKNIIETSGFLPEKQAIEYALQICSALSSAHKNGIIHRDIKPQNVLVTENDVAKITDFGIAKSVASHAEYDSQVIGSVYYVSPEQAKGEKVDQRTDIYSFGIMLYEMLTGELPYKGEKSVSVALKHINEQIIPPKRLNNEISESLNKIIIKATSKNKKDRYANIAELKKDLTLALVDKHGEFVEVNTNTIRKFSPINIRKNNIWKVAVITVTLAMLIVAGVFGGNAIFGTEQEQPITETLLRVPSTIGMNLIDAQEVLEELGLNVVIVYKNNDDLEEDTVMDQSPESGSKIFTEDSIMLTVSFGPQIVYMPNLHGMTEEEAKDALEDRGLIVEGITYEVSNQYHSGTVIGQEPAPESDMLEDSAVTFIVSKGPDEDKGTVPQVIDISLEQAIGTLDELGFVNTFVYQEPSDKEPGTVIGQSPQEGLSEPFERDIDLRISEYKDLEYVGTLDEVIEIADSGSKVKIVLEEDVGDFTTNFKIEELRDVEPGEKELYMQVESFSAGTKKVKVYINNDPPYEFSVSFAKRSEENEG